VSTRIASIVDFMQRGQVKSVDVASLSPPDSST
jgi:hypothetical protein